MSDKLLECYKCRKVDQRRNLKQCAGCDQIYCLKCFDLDHKLCMGCVKVGKVKCPRCHRVFYGNIEDDILTCDWDGERYCRVCGYDDHFCSSECESTYN